MRTASIQLGLAQDDAALRGADQLVGARRDEVRAGADRVRQRRLGLEAEAREVHQRAGAHVVDEHQIVRVRDRDQSRRAAPRRVKPDDLVVARVHAQDRGRVLA